MSLARRTSNRFSGSIWPGFVDAMTALLLVLMFVLSIFMIMQFILQETITGQESELDSLSEELEGLANTLGLERARSAALEAEAARLSDTASAAEEEIAAQSALIATLTSRVEAQEGQLSEARSAIATFEQQVAALLAARDEALASNSQLSEELEAARAEGADLASERDALSLALATAREEIDETAEAARLAAARREALEALVADLRSSQDANSSQVLALQTANTDLAEKFSAAEEARLAEAEAARLLRERLEQADSELTALTLSLEQQRAEAEETLTLLAAAQAAEEDLNARLAAAILQGDTFQRDLAVANDQSAALQEQLSASQTALEAEREKLRAALASSAAERLRLSTELQTLRASAEDADRQRAALEETVQSTEAARDEIAAELATLRQSLAELEAENAALRTASTDTSTIREQLTAALAAKLDAERAKAEALTESEERDIMLATANTKLAELEARSSADQRRLAVLNEQIAALRGQLGSLQAIIDDANDREDAAQVQIQTLGNELNAALARVASEERRRAALEAAEAERLREEAERLRQESTQLAAYRSEFFGRMREILADQEGVRIVGDRFVFSSEVLFDTGRADLSPEGRAQIANIAQILQSIADEIPEGIDWLIRVDGHTDNVPLSGFGAFADNWELSQGRALSVVRYMSENLGISPNRLSANGFGEHQPLTPLDTPQARAQNRRIELKLTER